MILFFMVCRNEFNDAYKINNPYYVEYSNVNKHFIFSNQSNSEIGILDENGKKIRSFLAVRF